MSIPQEERKSQIGTISSDLAAERAAEGGRLYNQGRLLSNVMGGFFPEGTDASAIHTVLDVACGSGVWATDVAYHYPLMQVYGVDVSSSLIEYARGLVRLRQHIPNVHFLLKDTFLPFDTFPLYFDFINARWMHGLMSNDEWISFLEECFRSLVPGGTLCVAEFEGISNSGAVETLVGICARAMWRLGRSFSPGGRVCGKTAVLGEVLRQLGFVEVRDQVHIVDFSSGEEHAELWHEDLMTLYKGLQPFLVRGQMIMNEEFEALYRQCLYDMSLDDFSGLLYVRSCWGEKPEGCAS